MNVEYINPFLLATKNVIETMAFTQVSAGKPYLKKDSRTWGVVSGLIGLAGEQVSGNMLLSFDEPSILHIVSKMLGEEFKSVSKDVTDAVGELTNMISGNAKVELNKTGLQFEMAIPATIIGKDVEITQMAPAPTVVIPFSCEAGKFVVEANLGMKKK